MRHLRKGRKLKRTASHRAALLASLSMALFRHKKIRTTVAKAKEARILADKLITKAKAALKAEKPEEKVHYRREVAKYINDKEVVAELFDEIAEKVADRNGGYTRVVKLGQRYGDGAQMAVLELVDYNLAQDKKAVTSRAKASRNSGTAKAKTKAEEKIAAEETTDEAATEPSASAESKAEAAQEAASEQFASEEPQGGAKSEGASEEKK
jgi:large subunit ribosomal protein L17